MEKDLPFSEPMSMFQVCGLFHSATSDLPFDLTCVRVEAFDNRQDNLCTSFAPIAGQRRCTVVRLWKFQVDETHAFGIRKK
jgi:hypothetical protein